MAKNPRVRFGKTLGQLGREIDNTADAQSGRRPMNGREMRVIEYLAAMDSKIVESGDAMRDRLRDIPNGWRQWRLMASTLSRLLVQLYDLMPIKNLRHIQNVCAHGEVLIRMQPASRVPEYTLVNEDDLRILVNTSMAAECAICFKEGKEIDRCPLRRAMLSIAPLMKTRRPAADTVTSRWRQNTENTCNGGPTMNKVIIIGNLTRDPEGGNTQSGVTWCRFTVAVTRRHAGADGQRQADFLNVVAWRTTAENCLRYLTKGRKVAVEGRIETRQYDGDDGQRRYVTEIVADVVEFVSSKQGGAAYQDEDENY